MSHVSVVIAAYNARSVISRAIDSALEQAGVTLEVLVVDDCSIDDTVELVSCYEKRDKRVRLLKCDKNGGPGFARNHGLAEAQGDWVAILDADDAFMPNRLHRLVTLGETYNADIVSDNLIMKYGDEVDFLQTMFSKDEWTSPTWLGLNVFINGNFGRQDQERRALGIMKPVIKRKFLVDHSINYEISRFAEDFILDLRMYANGAKWLVAPFAGYIYEVGGESLTMSTREIDIEQFIEAERAILSLPFIEQNALFKDAMSRHLKTLELGHAWTRFANNVKRGDVLRAAHLCASSPAATLHVAREIVRHFPGLLRKRLATKI